MKNFSASLLVFVALLISPFATIGASKIDASTFIEGVTEAHGRLLKKTKKSKSKAPARAPAPAPAPVQPVNPPVDPCANCDSNPAFITTSCLLNNPGAFVDYNLCNGLYVHDWTPCFPKTNGVTVNIKCCNPGACTLGQQGTTARLSLPIKFTP